MDKGIWRVNCLKALASKRDVIIQAGGNWGYWPLRLSDVFGVVYTFEPESECFACLTANTAHCRNVIRFQAALGDKRELVGLGRIDNSTGTQYVMHEAGGIYPTLRIDDLGLTECDVIYLDIQFEEPAALRGARETIARCKPMLICEVMTDFAEWPGKPIIEEMGYQPVNDINKCDVIMLPR